MIKKFITLLILAVFIWLIWSYSGRNMPLPGAESQISVIEEINLSDTLTRNIVGIQPHMVVTDYFNASIYEEKIRQYFMAAVNNGFIKKNTVTVYPEYIGTWLLLLGEKHIIADQSTLKGALNTLLFSNVFDYLLGIIKTGDEANKEASAIFRMKAKAMLNVYQETFGRLAEDTRSYIVAGSIVLPDPTVVDGIIYIDLNGPLYNASFIFGPDGKVVGEPIRKVFPGNDEADFLTAGPKDSFQVFDLPIGRTTVLVCTDSHRASGYKSLIDKTTEVVLVASYCNGEHALSSKWGTDPDGHLQKKSMPNSLNRTNLLEFPPNQVGINVFLHGDLWDLHYDGTPTAIYKGKNLTLSPSNKGGVWSLNF